jgi:ligand-binding sensor domain-containing protein
MIKMLKYLQTCLLYLLVLFNSGCSTQNKTDSLQTNISAESENLKRSYVPSSITRTIKLDSKENIWMASWEGVIKYDGISFTNMTNEVSLSRFFSILEDRKGNFWFGSIGSGVYYYDGKTFQNFTTEEGLVNNNVTHIYEDKAGNIWFGTQGGVSCFDGTSFRNYTMKDGLSNNDVNTIIEDKTGKFWLGTRGETYSFDGTSFTHFTNAENTPFINVRSIIEDKKGNIWLGGGDGLWRYDGEEFTSFTSQFVGYIYEDKAGNIWTSSESAIIHGWALSRYDEKSLSDGKTTGLEMIAEEGMFFGIVEDHQGAIWVGTLKGVYRYDGTFFFDFKERK